jgi:chemotaxis-related protein WspD
MSDLLAAAATSQRAVISDCWNKIGVLGDSSCPELKQTIHCRNCPVYSAAAVALLDTELPSDYRAHWANEIARDKTLTESDTHSVVVFRVAAECLALKTTVLQEIVSLRTIHSVPHRRDGVLLGLANVRGELLVCFSLHKVIGLEQGVELKPAKSRVSERLLVIQHNGERAVCPVDEVYGIARFHPRDLAAVPPTIARASISYTRSILSWQGKSIGLLDDELLLHTVNRNLA